MMESEFEAYIASESRTNALNSLNVGPIVAEEAEAEVVHYGGQYELAYEDAKPKVYKNYQFGRVLGEGNFGKVREAVHIFTGELVAIKIIHLKRLKKRRSGVDSVRREINIMRRLCHPNVARFIEVFEIEEKQKMYLVMELILGCSLRTLIEARHLNRLPFLECLWYFKQLIAGLEHCHTCGVVHRDIKPSNLMITREGVLKITDFGVSEDLSQVGHDLVTASFSNGTPSFISPQLAVEENELVSGIKVDIWAVGVTLYVISVGDVPFRGKTIFELLESIGKAEYALPSWLDSDLADLLRRLLDPSDVTRLTISQIKSHIWFTHDAPKPSPIHHRSPIEIPDNTKMNDGDDQGENSGVNEVVRDEVTAIPSGRSTESPSCRIL